MSDRIAALASRRTARQLELEGLIRAHALDLAEVLPSGTDLNPIALLGALAWQESSFGRDGGHCRREAAYRPKGIYFGAPHMQAIYAVYGDAGASSWSSWQLLYVAAWEVDFNGPPWDLHDDALALPVVIRYLDRSVFREGARTVEDVADNYNSGTHKDQAKVPEYVKSFAQHYDRCLSLLARGLPMGP